MRAVLSKVHQPFLQRLFAFLTVFIVFSGLIGPRIISSGILYRDGFGWYGGAGKTLVFGVVAFALLAYHSNIAITLPRWRRYNFSWLALALLSFAGGWVAVHHLIAGQRTAFWLVSAHTLLLASVVFALGGCFGPAALRAIMHAYRRELLIAFGAGLGFYALLTLIYHLWTIMAGVVLHSVAWLLRLNGLSVAVVQPRTLLLDKFGITVAQSCSGIESLALFSGMYAVVAFLDWRRFNKRRLLGVFPLALLLLFACNILRVYVLILAGYYINPQLAFSLFHTYAGMLFFVLYSLAFWGVMYRWLTRSRATA